MSGAPVIGDTYDMPLRINVTPWRERGILSPAQGHNVCNTSEEVVDEVALADSLEYR